eukprot:Nk52_evm20s2241 gene=Nk52_evmTU20s2241
MESQSLPVTDEIALVHGSKTVSCLSLDPSGNRLASGGYDNKIKLWDFQGMDMGLRAFRMFEPTENYPVRSAEFSLSGDRLLVTTGTAQAQILDREGRSLLSTPKGDQYMSDMGNTKGHVGELKTAKWHPEDKNTFLTCGVDGSVRVWDVNGLTKHKAIAKTKNAQGRKAEPSTIAYDFKGSYFGVACEDGSIQLFKSKGPYVRPAMNNKTCHANGTSTSCLAFSVDGTSLISRGGDDTLKLWDVRKFREPVASVSGLENVFAMTDCVFSPNEKIVVTGTSARVNSGQSGCLKFFDAKDLSEVRSIDVTKGSVVSCLWNRKLNQIMAGCADGQVKVYFDWEMSEYGALLCTKKAKKRAEPGAVNIDVPIITPHSLSLFRDKEAENKRRRKEKDRKDPIKSKRPEMRVGGRVGNNLDEFMGEGKGLVREDPREAILKHAKAAEENPMFVSNAYKKTQPVAIFEQERVEGRDDEDEEDK